jgi:hypothetical protein
MNQSRWLKGKRVRFPPQISFGDAVKLRINQRHQAIECRAVASIQP